MKNLFDLIRDVVRLETSTEVGRVNMRNGVLVLVLVSAVIAPDIVITIINPVIEKLFELSLPAFPNHVLVLLIVVAIVYYLVSAYITAKTEERLTVSK